MEIKDRIRMIMEREKVPPRVFAETIGVQQSTLSHILNDRNKPSLEVVMKVHQKYTTLYKSNITFVYQTKTVNTNIYL